MVDTATVLPPKKPFQRLANLFGYELFRPNKVILPRPGYHQVPDIYGKAHQKLIDIRTHEPFYTLAQAARQDKRTLLYFDRLYTLYQAVENLSRIPNASNPLTLIEVGVYRGGGTAFLAQTAAKLLSNPINVYAVDTFSGHSALDIPSGRDGDHLPGQFADQTSFEEVQAYLAPFKNVTVIQNRIQDCAERFVDETFHLVHLDVDIYEPTRFGLTFFGDRLAPQGIIVVDDYGYTSCPGARRAVEEYLAGSAQGRFVRFELLTGQCLLIRSA